MSTWFYKHLGDAMTAVEPSDQIREAFPSRLESAGNRAEMAIFTRNGPGDGLHCEVFVYFSPATIKIAQAFNAKPCERPLRPGLELLAGNKSCWFVLFPENEQ